MSSIALGIAIGLLITWVLLPVQFVNADPVDLRQSHKDDYVRMISAAYRLDGDLADAKRQLNRLGLENPDQSIDNLITREMTRTSATRLEALTGLRAALSAKNDSSGQQPAHTAQATSQAVVVVTTPTQPVPTFHLVEHTQLGCADEPESPHLRFVVRDADGLDLPNVGIQIRWEGGDDTVYTGLKPERGTGYADFEATPGTFSVTIINARSETVSDLLIGDTPVNCKADRGATPRGWKLVFQQK